MAGLLAALFGLLVGAPVARLLSRATLGLPRLFGWSLLMRSPNQQGAGTEEYCYTNCGGQQPTRTYHPAHGSFS